LAAHPDDGPIAGWLLWLAAQLQFPTALFLVLSFACDEGLFAAILALPWLVTTALSASAGLVRIWRRGRGAWEELCVDAGLVYLVVGGGWAVLSRAGMRPLNFETVIVLLTAIHFHYAGILLPVLTGLAGRARPGVTARAASLGVVLGVPLVATGITATQLGLGSLLECTAAWVTAGAGLLTATLHLRLAMAPKWSWPVRVCWTIAGLSLATSMILAALYGFRAFAPLDWLDIPWMRALHGTANALGFGLCGVVGWSLEKRRPVQSASQSLAPHSNAALVVVSR
jgi:hypothetical protein